MPKTKKTIRKKSPVITSAIDNSDSHQSYPVETISSVSQHKSFFGPRLFFISGGILLFVLGLLLFRKGYIVTTVVDGKPIFYFQLQSVLMNRFGKQALEGMITETLIANAAEKSGITISNEEVAAKEAELLKSFGGKVSVEEILKFQGITKEEFDKQVRIQLTVGKILEKDIVLGEADIDAYIAANKATLQATDAMAIREEARTALMAQKVGEKVQPWFQELKEKAKILRFIPE